ncbi:tetratricopeptide repeat protein [Sphingopyxis panaciterrae]
MRRPKLTGRPGRAARHAGALAALLFGAAIVAPAQGLQVTPPDAATKAAMDKRTAARTLLSSALARIAANNADTGALLDAGRASIDLEDYRAALGFLVRAEQGNPRDGAVKAALGSTMVHMENPTRALDYFGEAQLLGASERLFLADRGLARDLLGQQDAAQRDYQLALSVAPNDEVTRRYALSLAIAGDANRGIQMLTPQLRNQDRGAWRLRAMMLAIAGRDDEATQVVNATMPPQLAQNILPYLTQMDRLNPAQQAAAAHFGRFPSGELGPRRKPIQVAAATPPAAPTPAPAATKRRSNSERARVRGTVLPAPVRRSPEPPAAVPSARPAAVTTAPPTSVSTPTPTPAPAPGQTVASAGPTPSRVPIYAPASTPAPAPAPAAAPESSPIGVAVRRASGPVGPGFSIADFGQTAASVPSDPAARSPGTTPPPPAASPPPSTPTPAPVAAIATPPAASSASSASSAAPLASLADIVGSIEIPAEELAGSANAIGADTLAKLQQDKRRADAAEAAKREKDAVAAKAKADAEAKAKEEAAEKKANPARIWAQVATGANAKALATDFGKFAKKNPDIFKGKSAATAEWGKTRRLLVGPFKDRKTAQDWLASYKKAGGDGFLFSSEVGQEVDPVK